ncbi:rod shape-determining protein MreD [Maribellus maritimus]|uniref:rod shape-determining protein MreD n=1 Tax=Maribellus maritimus TaxID=2870838 RepID=UPI001EEAFCBF|nr:rod shape-determining protein MreD [Maribellus maritimus]MCG6186142.1 rod shape-determining protein MreD [Maribellus maritimus]
MFISLVLVQVLVLNQIQVSGYLNPYIYVLFIMLLPLSLPLYIVLPLAFLTGLTVDVFSNTLGIHAAATTFIAYIRPLVSRSISTHEEDRSDYPGMKYNGFRWFLYYTIIMVFFHHAILFFLEIFTFADFVQTFYRIVLSSLFSIFIIVLSQFIVFRD